MSCKNVDLVLDNGKVITLDANDTIAEAIAVHEGKIAKVGHSHEVLDLADNNTQKIDLKGKTILPGFIDTHTHVDMYGMMTSDLVIDCHIPPIESVDKILKDIKRKVVTMPEGTLILGQGRPSQAYPTKMQLDEIAPNHPVVIKPSMHYFLLNSCALKKFNIDTEHPSFEELFAVDPGGSIQRNSETCEPTGYVVECWNYMFPRSRSPFTYEQTRRVIKEGIDKHSKYGITSISEFLSYAESAMIYQDLYNKGELNMRLQLIPCFHGLYKTVELDELIHAGFRTGFGNDWIKFGGVKMFVDRMGHTSCSSIQVKEWFSKAHRAGMRMFMHAISRKAQDIALEAIEAVAEESDLHEIKILRHRIEHMGNECYDPNYFPRIRNLDVIALPTAYFMNAGSSKHLSPKTEKSFMFRTMIDEGLCVPGNSDGAGAFPEALNPLYQIWCMVNRKSSDGELICPSEKISVLEALKVYTIHSAYASLEEKIKGSIEVGKLADFVVLAEDPLVVNEDYLKNIEVEMTILGGKIVYKRGESHN